MRRYALRLAAALPLVLLGPLTGCAVTDRQMMDFASSTVIRVFVQGVIDLIEAGVLNAAGAT